MADSPNYLHTQAVTEGLDRTAQALLTAGTAMIFGGRSLPYKAAGALVLVGYYTVRRARNSHRINQELILPVDLPLSTRTALHLVAERHHNGATNFGLQVAVDELVAATQGTDAPKNLLLTAPEPKEDSCWSKIRDTHHALETALTDHFNRPALQSRNHR